jgi:hypothetical protein
LSLGAMADSPTSRAIRNMTRERCSIEGDITQIHPS